MFDFANFAVDGLMPGMFSHSTVATGGAMEIQVVIEPVVLAPSGGGYVPWTSKSSTKPDRYSVTITVTINGKRYSDSKIVDDIEARVIAKFNGIEFDEFVPTISINGVQVVQEQTEVEVTAFLIQ
jgi:hypothetical protein